MPSSRNSGVAGGFFAERPRLAAVASVSLALVGACAAFRVGLSDYPEVAPPVVQVSATYSGASPSVVADTVATPIEDQINSVEDVYFFDSTCFDTGAYSLCITFRPGSDPDMNLVNVQNAIKRAEPKLPSEVLQTGLAVQKYNADYAIQFVVTADGDGADPAAMGNFANHDVKDSLQRVRGVMSVACSDTEYAMRVWLDTMKMDALGVSVGDVRGAIAGQNIQPAAGFVGNAMSSPFLSYKVNAPGRLLSSDEFEAIIVRSDASTGARVRLGDVARCELGTKAYTKTPCVGGMPCCIVTVTADTEANTREVASEALATMRDVMRRAPSGVGWRVLRDQHDFIDEIMSRMGLFMSVALLLSAVFFAVLAGFRLALRAAVVVAVSLLAAIAVVWAAGWTIDAITSLALLAGAALSLAIAAGGVSWTMAALVAAAFAPLVAYGGMTGAMFVRFAAVMVSVALCASLLAAMFPGRRRPVAALGRTPSFVRLAFVLLVAAALALPALRIPRGFVPDEDRGFFKIDIELSEGSSIARTREVAARADRLLSEVPGIDFACIDVGGSGAGKLGENYADMRIRLKPWKARGGLSVLEISREAERRLAAISTAKFHVIQQTPLRGTGGIGGCMAMLCATGAADPAELAADAEAYADGFRAMDGVLGVVTTFAADTPQLYFSVDRDKAQSLGVSVADVFSTLQSKLASFYVNDFNIDGCSRQVIVQNDYEGRDAVEDAMSLRFPGADGAMVPLSSVGEFRHMLGPRAIMRRDKRPYAGIVIRPGEGASTLEMVRRIEENPPDERKYVVAYSTMTQEEVASRGKFGRMAAAGLMLMYLVLVAATESWLAPIRHLTDALPAVAGGVFGIWVAEQEFTILAQLALMFVFAFSAGISLRPLRAVPAAFAAALGVAILASVLLPGVGASTFRAFAVPFASGMAVLLLAQAALHKTFNNKTEEEST